MSIKDILVHLDGGSRDAGRTALALTLAQRFGARLTGLFARQEHSGPSLVARRASEALTRAAAEAETVFATAADAAGVPWRWWRLAHGDPAHVLSETVICARFADLSVLGQHQDDGYTPDDLVEQVILQSGRPVLVVPSAGDYADVGRRVILAWDGGREAARALHDALPLIEGAEIVEAVTVHGHRPAPSGEVMVPAVNILDHLTAHGVKVTREHLAGEDIGVMDLLLNRAADSGADLLVMGAQGGSFLGLGKGAGTRHILKHMTLPVLLSH